MKRGISLLVAFAAVAALLPVGASAKQVGATVELEVYGLIESNGAVSYHFTGLLWPDGLGPPAPPPEAPPQGRKKTDDLLAALKCMQRRAVTLLRDEPEGPDTVVGQAETFLGIFFAPVEVPAQQVPGSSYYAQVSEKKTGKKPKLNCLAATSPTVAVQPPQFRSSR